MKTLFIFYRDVWETIESDVFRGSEIKKKHVVAIVNASDYIEACSKLKLLRIEWDKCDYLDTYSLDKDVFLP